MQMNPLPPLFHSSTDLLFITDYFSIYYYFQGNLTLDRGRSISCSALPSSSYLFSDVNFAGRS